LYEAHDTFVIGIEAVGASHHRHARNSRLAIALKKTPLVRRHKEGAFPARRGKQFGKRAAGRAFR
jgi:hypothetical protein